MKNGSHEKLNVLPRRVLAPLERWAGSADRLPLLIRGARQVGKTYSVGMLAKRLGLDLVTVDLEFEPDLARLFEEGSPAVILRDLELWARKPLVAGRSLLFFDEIQAAPRALTMLRFFREQHPALHVVAAGSLLELALSERRISMPVGRVQTVFLGPMSFEETLTASGDASSARWLEEYHVMDEVPEATHRFLMERLRSFLLTGGMPRAVARSVAEGSVLAAQEVHRGLLRTFEDDLGKHRGRVDHTRIQRMLRAVPHLIGERIKYTRLDPDSRADSTRRALDLLVGARIATRVLHSSCDGPPLGAQVNDRRFKLLYLDVGLVSTAGGMDLVGLRDVADLVRVDEGRLAEQLVGQELLAGLPFEVTPELHFWCSEKKGATAEVDYAIVVGGDVVPVEVKAGKTGSLRSLHQIMSRKGLPLAVRLNADRPSVHDVEHRLRDGSPVRYRLLSLPLYLAGQVRRLAAEVAARR